MHEMPSKVRVLPVPPLVRAGNKLASVNSNQPGFDAVVDALCDIRPRRTQPEASEVVLTPRDHVYLICGPAAMFDCGPVEKIREHLHGIASAAELDEEERAALLQAVDEAYVPVDPFDEEGA